MLQDAQVRGLSHWVTSRSTCFKHSPDSSSLCPKPCQGMITKHLGWKVYMVLYFLFVSFSVDEHNRQGKGKVFNEGILFLIDFTKNIKKLTWINQRSLWIDFCTSGCLYLGRFLCQEMFRHFMEKYILGQKIFDQYMWLGKFLVITCWKYLRVGGRNKKQVWTVTRLWKNISTHLSSTPEKLFFF